MIVSHMEGRERCPITAAGVVGGSRYPSKACRNSSMESGRWSGCRDIAHMMARSVRWLTEELICRGGSKLSGCKKRLRASAGDSFVSR